MDTPYSILHNIGRNVCVVTNVAKKLNSTDDVAPADRVSKLCISTGTNQPKVTNIINCKTNQSRSLQVSD